MSSDVALKKPRSGKALATIWTLAAQVVRPQVHGVGRHGDIGFLTMWAFSSFFVLQRPEKGRKFAFKTILQRFLNIFYLWVCLCLARLLDVL